MSRLQKQTLFLLILCVLVLLGFTLNNHNNNKSVLASLSINTSTYTIQHSVTRVFDLRGLLNYKLISDHVIYTSDDRTSLFTLPMMTLFDDQGRAIWSIRSNQATLTADKMLYLQSDVQIDNLAAETELQRIRTESASINLNNQDIASDDPVTLYGSTFRSNGMKMRGNLQENRAKLIEKVSSYYEIPTAPETH